MEVRTAERGERVLDSVQPHHAGDERAGIDVALGEHVQRVAELERRVAEHEAQVDLLVDGHRGRDLIDADAHADHDDAREQRRPVDDGLDHAGHPDALEDDRVLGRRAERLAEPPGMPPAEREALQLLARGDGKLERGGNVGKLPAPLHGSERGVVRRVKDDVRAAGAGQRAARGRVVAGNDRAHTLGLQQKDDRQPDRPAADDDRHGALAHLAAAHGMPGHGHRQCRDVGPQAVGHWHHQRLLHEHLLGVGTGRVHRQADGVDALTAAQERQRDDARARRRALAAAGAVLGDLAAELVAEHDLLL